MAFGATVHPRRFDRRCVGLLSSGLVCNLTFTDLGCVYFGVHKDTRHSPHEHTV